MEGSRDGHEDAARAPSAAKWPGDGGPRGGADARRRGSLVFALRDRTADFRQAAAPTAPEAKDRGRAARFPGELPESGLPRSPLILVDIISTTNWCSLATEKLARGHRSHRYVHPRANLVPVHPLRHPAEHYRSLGKVQVTCVRRLVADQDLLDLRELVTMVPLVQERPLLRTSEARISENLSLRLQSPHNRLNETSFREKSSGGT